MTDPFRGGGFGGIGMGPFQTGGGGDSRYLIANDGDNVAATRKYSAQVAWANGTISDGQYLGVLNWYVGTTEAGSRERVAAQNEYDDAVYSIGRNRIVRDVNNADTGVKRVAALRRLIGYDRKKLRTMTQDNEQRRELQDRIASSESTIRETRYADLVRRFNRDQVGIGSMLSFVRGMAAESRGGPDATAWQDKVREWQDRQENEVLDQLIQDYQMNRVPGSAVIDHLKGRLAGMDPESPDYKATARQLEDLTKQITEKERSDKDADMASKMQNGDITDAQYIRYLRARVDDYDKGTPERRSAQDNWLQMSYQLGEADLRRKVADGAAQPQDLVDFYHSYMASMSPSSSRFLELQQRITDLLVSGAGTLALYGGQGGGGSPGGYAGAGRWVDLSGAPGGTPVNAKGFASQFDGSAFAGSNCGMASAAMLVWAGTDGRVRVSGGDLRYYSGDRDTAGDEKGTTFDDITVAVQALGLGLQQQHGMDFAAFRQRLARGEGALISGSYADAPANLKLSTFDGPHTMYVDRARKINGQWFYYVMDPIGRSGYNGTWWPEEAVRTYGWSNTPNRTGTWFGDVAFLAKKGRSSSFFNPDRPAPPFQAFDTDADGNSTVGRGGGTSRAEAGRRRDWSKGRAKEPKSNLVGRRGDPQPVQGTARAAYVPDDSAVAEFLAAVDAVEKPTMADVPGGPLGARAGIRGDQAQREDAARAALQANGGDARLAAIAWFTGVKPDTDTSTWDGTTRFYANAVGTRLGYDPVQRGAVGDIDPTKPPAPLGAVFTGPRSPESQQPVLDSLPQKPRELAALLLEELGVPASPDMVRAVVAWMATEGGAIKGNNAFVLRTKGSQDLPGQVAVDPQTGLAIFNTPEDGVRAAADEILRNLPGLVAAARSGDPERFLVALDRSDWVKGGYGGTLIRTYNELPGNDKLIIGGGAGLLTGAGDLRGLARQEPQIAELFDVDPRDPAQMAWLDANVKAIKEATTAGRSTWTFTTQGGQPVELDLAPGMAGEMTWTKFAYLDAYAKASPTVKDALDRRAAADTAMRDHMSTVGNATYAEWDAQMGSLEESRQLALQTNDFTSYYNLTAAMHAATAIAFGGDPRGDIDVRELPGWGLLTDQQQRSLTARVDAFSEAGDPVRQMEEQGIIYPQRDLSTGAVVAVSIPPDKGYVAWKPDGSTELRTLLTHETDFTPAPVPTTQYDTGNAVGVPQYMLENGLVVVGGRAAYAPIQSGRVRVDLLDTAGTRTANVAADLLGVGRKPGRTQTSPIGPGGFQRDWWAPGGQGAESYFERYGTPDPTGSIITVATRDDQQLVHVPGGMLTVQMMTVNVRNSSGRIVPQVWYSIPGSNEWIGGDVSPRAGAMTTPGVGSPSFLNNTPLRLVVNTADGWSMKDGKLLINGSEPPANAPLSAGVHWYGTRPTDFATGDRGPEMGAPGAYFKRRQGMPLPGGGFALDTAQADPVQQFLEGDVSFSALLGGGIRSTYQGAQRSREQGGIVRSDRPGAMPPGGITEGARSQFKDAEWVSRVDWGTIAGREPGSVPGLERIATMNLPVSAGASKVATQPTPGLLSSFNARLSTGVRASADAAVKAAEAQRTIARERAATQAAIAQQQAAARQIQQVQARETPQARMADQISSSIQRNQPTPQPTPRPTPQPTPRAQPTPAPTPTPTPTPAPSPRRVITPGMEV